MAYLIPFLTCDLWDIAFLIATLADAITGKAIAFAKRPLGWGYLSFLSL